MVRLIALLCLLLLPASLWAASEESLENLIRQRLLLMKDVAAYKWQHQLAVEDPEREVVVLAAAIQDGLRVGLTTDSSAGFFQTQMEAGKEIQAYWIERWNDGAAKPERIPDLAVEIRPKLLQLGEQITSAVAQTPAVDGRQFLSVLDVEGLSKRSREQIYDAFAGLDYYPDRLTQILDSGFLRIGTTGDYAPFSLKADGATEFSGVDIELAWDLANALGVKPVFVQTSWPTLMDDLQSGNFDIAMGGISRILERQRQGFFSQPYHADGKTALTRCADKHKFKTLADIDKPNVRLVVNPGGTNQRFVDDKIKQARKIIHDDNRDIFALLVEGKADVMITDRIEAEWQAAKLPVLCVPVAENFTYQEKAYLMPRDIALKEFVDTWLSLRLAEGKVQRLLRPSSAH